MRKKWPLLAAGLMLTACSEKENRYDAMGMFEATEIVVSAKAQGEIVRFVAEEGIEVKKGDTLGVIDCVRLALQQQGLAESEEAQRVRVLNLKEQMAGLRQQIQNAEAEYKRFSALLTRGAATQKQVDDLANKVEVLKSQFNAGEASLRSANESLTRQAGATGKQREIVESQMNDAVITSPADGTILLSYTEQGEYAIPGKPLFKVADLKEMTLRAYITASQYDALKLGQEVVVKVDNGPEDQREYQGKVSWIARKAEFTPKTIQTRDERANLVYAIKVTVHNDGYIKIGQYGECYFDK